MKLTIVDIAQGYHVLRITGDYSELPRRELNIGTLDKEESIEMAQQLLNAAEKLLRGSNLYAIADLCSTCSESIDNLNDEK